MKVGDYFRVRVIHKGAGTVFQIKAILPNGDALVLGYEGLGGLSTDGWDPLTEAEAMEAVLLGVVDRGNNE